MTELLLGNGGGSYNFFIPLPIICFQVSSLAKDRVKIKIYLARDNRVLPLLFISQINNVDYVSVFKIFRKRWFLLKFISVSICFSH